MIACRHYTPLSSDGGTCAAGLFGGRPSNGTCANCRDRDKPLDEIPKPAFRTAMHKLNPDGTRCKTCTPVVVTYTASKV